MQFRFALEDGTDVVVTGELWPGDPGSRYEPPEPTWFEIESAVDEDGNEVEVSDEDNHRITDYAIEDCAQERAEYRASLRDD